MHLIRCLDAVPSRLARRAGEQDDNKLPTAATALGGRKHRRGAWDPRASWATEWDGAYLLACAAGLMVDPFFASSWTLMCVFLNGWFARGFFGITHSQRMQF